MNNFIHRYKKTIFWIIFLGFIFATFAYFGAGGYLTKGTDTVATVNSEKISYSKYYENTVRALDNQRNQKKGEDMTDDERKQVRLGVFRSMLTEAAFNQSARKYGLKVTDAEVVTYLQQIPAFQKNGRFDHATYFQILKYGIKMTPEDFEESRRSAILEDRMKFLISTLAKVTEPEARSEYLRRNGSMNGWDKEKSKFLDTLMNEKGNYLFGQWVIRLQQQTQIKEYLSKFENNLP